MPAAVTPARSVCVADVPQPFPYQGSKRALASEVLRYLPSDVSTLIEPFAGSAAVSIAARHAGVAEASVLNDINAPLMQLWQAIIADPVLLADEYEQLWTESLADPKAFFYWVRAEFNRHPSADRLLYLLNRIVKGAVRYSAGGAFNQSADNRRIGARPAVVRDRLLRTSRVLDGARLSSQPYEALLIGAGPRDVVYLDPPYQGVSSGGDHRYLSGLNREPFERALFSANEAGVSYLVSYDEVRPDHRYGRPLDESLGLTHLHLQAGRSAQSTLGGGCAVTVESLYLSPALVARL